MEIQNGVMSWQKLATSEVGLSESLVCRVVLYVRFIKNDIMKQCQQKAFLLAQTLSLFY